MKISSDHTGEGVVIDLGTGDGRFVSAAAKKNPRKFYIGIDAAVDALRKPSMKATRKPAKGGLPNVMFIQAAVEDLPEELDGVADEIHVHFPWGSLLAAVLRGDARVLAGLRRIAAPDCLLEIIVGIDPTRDRAELERLGIPDLTDEYLREGLLQKYAAAGFEYVHGGRLAESDWAALETSWARRLSGNSNRIVASLVLRAV